MSFFVLVFIVFGIGIASAAAYTDAVPVVALSMLLEDPDLMVIDVSPIYGKGHLPRSVNHPVGDGSLEEGIPMLDKSKSYLVYCHGDGPSMAGAQDLVDTGFKNVYRLDGNYRAWVDSGYPISFITPYMDVLPKEDLKLMLENPDLIIIDVSPVYDQGHLPMAVNYPVGDGTLDKMISMLDLTQYYLVYCHMESASVMGAQKMVDAGFDKVYRLQGEYSGWTDIKYPVEK